MDEIYLCRKMEIDLFIDNFDRASWKSLIGNLFYHVLLRPSRNHLLSRDSADGRLQAGTGVYRGDFPERCAGAGGAVAECAVELVCRTLRL